MGQKDMPADEAAKSECHSSGQGSRTRNAGPRSGTSQNEAVWSRLYDAGVDLLNADDLGGSTPFCLNDKSTMRGKPAAARDRRRLASDRYFLLVAACTASATSSRPSAERGSALRRPWFQRP